jgi:hypothetical protein
VKLKTEQTTPASVLDIMFYMKTKEKVVGKSEDYEKHLVDGQRGYCDGLSSKNGFRNISYALSRVVVEVARMVAIKCSRWSSEYFTTFGGGG